MGGRRHHGCQADQERVVAVSTKMERLAPPVQHTHKITGWKHPDSTWTDEAEMSGCQELIDKWEASKGLKPTKDVVGFAKGDVVQKVVGAREHKGELQLYVLWYIFSLSKYALYPLPLKPRPC